MKDSIMATGINSSTSPDSQVIEVVDGLQSEHLGGFVGVGEKTMRRNLREENSCLLGGGEVEGFINIMDTSSSLQ